jgi:hypothetical protein
MGEYEHRKNGISKDSRDTNICQSRKNEITFSETVSKKIYVS